MGLGRRPVDRVQGWPRGLPEVEAPETGPLVLTARRYFPWPARMTRHPRGGGGQHDPPGRAGTEGQTGSPGSAPYLAVRRWNTGSSVGIAPERGPQEVTRQTTGDSARSTAGRLAGARVGLDEEEESARLRGSRDRPIDRTGPHEITGLLRQAAAGRRDALDELMPLVYDELSGMARARLRHEAPGHTLETAGLVHEAWLRLIDQHRANWRTASTSSPWPPRRCDASSSTTPSVVARPSAAGERLTCRSTPPTGLDGRWAGHDPDDTVVALDDALDRLAAFNADGARVVQYRFFAGLSNGEVAELLGTSERTVRRAWTAARAWLRRELVTAR